MPQAQRIFGPVTENKDFYLHRTLSPLPIAHPVIGGEKEKETERKRKKSENIPPKKHLITGEKKASMLNKSMLSKSIL